MKIGIIGCGKIAQVRHIPEYESAPSKVSLGFYDLNRERAEELAEKYGGTAYASVEEMLADPEIKAVSVCTANTTHADITIKALEAGKHVLCEKPMATSLADCERMVSAAKKADKLLIIDQNQRLAAAHVKAKELIDAGEIGRILTFRTTFGHGGPETWSIDPGKGTWFFDKSRAAMGAMADLGVHKTDLIQYLTGSTVVETTAQVMTLDKTFSNGQLIGVDDNAICIYRMESGVIGTMTASWTYYGAEDNSTILYGSKGILRIYDDPDHSITLICPDGQTAHYDVDAIQTNDKQTDSGIIRLFLGSIEAFEAGQELPQTITGESVLSAMRAVFASLESSERGCKVEIPANR